MKKTELAVITNVKVDAPSFELVKSYTGSYYRDKDSVFYYDINKNELRKVEGGDRNSFVEMDNFFAKDNKNVYYLGKQVRNISSEGFKFVGPDIFKNKNGVYFWKDETGTGDYEIVSLNRRTFKMPLLNLKELICQHLKCLDMGIPKIRIEFIVDIRNLKGWMCQVLLLCWKMREL